MFVDKEKDCLKDYISGKLGITGGKLLLAFFKGTCDPKKPTTPEKNLVTFTRRFGRETAAQLFNLVAPKMI